jgi:hypothetical protein
MAMFFQPCIVDVENQTLGETTILIEQSYFDTCLPRLFFTVIGLNETVGPLPTVTSIDSNYRVATLADRAFVFALYSDDFQTTFSEVETYDFFLNKLQFDVKIRDILSVDLN